MCGLGFTLGQGFTMRPLFRWFGINHRAGRVFATSASWSA
jgi:hypothetical protein